MTVNEAGPWKKPGPGVMVLRLVDWIMSEEDPWKRPGAGVIVLRLVDLVVRYVLVFALTWVLVEAALPPEAEVPETGLDFFPFIGIPSIVISCVYGLASKAWDSMAFRAPLAVLLLLPTWFLLFGNFVEMLLIPVVGQLLFALCVMRAPMLGPSVLRRWARAVLARWQ
ncbi:hypothetical protein ACFVZW_33380 [Streptomyces sp. NPDC059567]|uniref:hypothetical protein n=1 Tax=Streptomyces sp. NPDC059567 TaxID=3346867 RepID=UPI0036B53C6D